MTNDEYKDSIRAQFLKLWDEFEATHKQMTVNCDYAKRYGDALEQITRLLGYVPNAGCTGKPRELDKLAIDLVREKINQQSVTIKA